MDMAVSMAKERAARISVISNTLLVVLKVLVGIIMGSVSVISEGIHSGLDLLAALIAYFSVKKAGEPADEIHPYGHGKYENVSGTVEALLIIVAALYIIYEGVRKLTVGVEVEALGLGMGVMGLSALVNFFVSRYLFRVAKETDSVALEADALHLRTDVYTSLGVLAGLVAIKVTGVTILDPIIAIVMALMILQAAYKLTKGAISDIIDTRLPDEEQAIIRNVLECCCDEYLEYHKLRTRKAGSERYIDLHLVVPKERPVSEVHALCDQIEADIKNSLPNTHTLIHIEPCTNMGCVKCDECGKIEGSQRRE
ncbi:MAG: cation diffusion facilitator family transporter [Clostridia bacterium]|nr:cation diffusion facilitator family transporter [Clostridia bacterium]